uniref:Uncharacterized protein ycf33 n=1 Tax=Sphondylothamnion multifidum TaxID=193186 RepID=A0A4D6X014_9FLOR|nr:hypothetical protein [Sphondylothamnion multifidum]
MHNFWDNIYKFPRFLLATFLGFFLTTFQPIFKLLKNTKTTIIITTTITIIIVNLCVLIKLMLGLK